MSFGIHTFLSSPSTYFTILRDPVKRALSFYRYIFQTPNHYLYDRMIKTDMSLEDFVRSRLTSEMNNHQTRMLAAINHEDVPYGECNYDMLEVAKKNLQDQFAVVGLVDRYDETLILLHRTLCWPKLPFYIKRNITKKVDETQINAQTIHAISHDNALDIELYQYAQMLFEQTIQAQSDSFQKKLRLFKLLNYGYGKLFGAYQLQKKLLLKDT